jgi:hypothetical protein
MLTSIQGLAVEMNRFRVWENDEPVLRGGNRAGWSKLAPTKS